MVDSQIEIKKWFNKTYQEKGFKYLRPLDAYKIFRTLLAPTQGTKHLDVACGLGLMLKTLEDTQAELHGVELSTEAIKVSQEYCSKSTIVEANAENLPYENNTFDSITCIGSLERMLNRDKALSEQFRVAKRGAKVCLMVRNSENFTWKYIWKPLNLYNKKGHQDALNLDQWKSLFCQNGFIIESIYPDHWPYYRFLKFILPWVQIDTSKVRKFAFSIRNAYEFIFVLHKP
jgi:SAM-dependent methyltransferase